MNYSNLPPMHLAGQILVEAQAGPRHSYEVIKGRTVTYTTSDYQLAQSLREWLDRAGLPYEEDGMHEFITRVNLLDLRVFMDENYSESSPVTCVPNTTSSMLPLTSPPTDPSQVVIVMQLQNHKLLATTFKYKNGKWCGQATGVKYTTEELVDDPSTAFWIVSPLQPNYKDQDAALP